MGDGSKICFLFLFLWTPYLISYKEWILKIRPIIFLSIKHSREMSWVFFFVCLSFLLLLLHPSVLAWAICLWVLWVLGREVGPELLREFRQSTSSCHGLPAVLHSLTTFYWFVKLVSMLGGLLWKLPRGPRLPNENGSHFLWGCNSQGPPACQSFSRERSSVFFTALPGSVLEGRKGKTRKPNSNLFSKESHHVFYLPLYENKFF